MRKQIEATELINLWLEKCHGVKFEHIFKVHPEWEKDEEKYTRDFYQTYAVTQEQHDQWYEEAITLMSKRLKMSKKSIKNQFTFTYLNVAPSIKK